MIDKFGNKALKKFLSNKEILLVKSPSSIAGFSDNFTIQKVKKANRIGVLVDIIDKKDAGIKDISKEILVDEFL